MIRPVTIICLLLFFGSGLYLYSAKHKALMLDHDIARLVKEAQETRQRAVLLNAEYDLLCAPDRLQALSAQILQLQTTAPAQFTTLADLTPRLDEADRKIRAAQPVTPPAPEASSDKPGAAQPAGDKPTADTSSVVASAAQRPPPPKPATPPAPQPATTVVAASVTARPVPASSSAGGSSLGLARTAAVPAAAPAPQSQPIMPLAFVRTASEGNR